KDQLFIRVPYSGEAEIPASPYFFIGECASPTGWRGISGSVAWGDAPCSGVSGFQPDDRPGECAEFDNESVRAGSLKGFNTPARGSAPGKKARKWMVSLKG